MCVHCLSVYLCESLNSISCFLCFGSCCFTDTARSYGPHTAFIISVFSFFLLCLCPISSPSFYFLFSSFLAAPCCFPLHSNFHLLKSEGAEADKTWARESRGEVGADRGMLKEGCWWRGLERPADIRESHWGERWYDSCCVVFFLLLVHSHFLLIRPFSSLCRRRKGTLSAETVFILIPEIRFLKDALES